MNTDPPFKKILEETRVLRFPRHQLATFGSTEIQYHLVTAVSAAPAQSNLRTGLLIAKRPKIVTPESLADRFEGFGEQAKEFEKWLKEHYREAFRALEYNFRNQPENMHSHALDARELSANIERDLDRTSPPRSALLFAPESGWTFALMKFILEETWRSFKSNVQELEDRGLFDPAQADLQRRRRDIESLFRAARQDASALRVLGERLKEYGLFEEYQDRFFALVRPD
jgi:hypothetical protein